MGLAAAAALLIISNNISIGDKAASHVSKETPSKYSLVQREADNQLHQPDPAAMQAVAEYLSHKYKVPVEKTKKITEWGFLYGLKYQVDPLIVLSVAATESSLQPKAKSYVGAVGLMQTWTKWHPEIFGTGHGKIPKKMTPEQNIEGGTKILAKYVLHETKNKKENFIADALQRYNGNKKDVSYAYASKVLGNHEELTEIFKKNATKIKVQPWDRSVTVSMLQPR